MSSKRRNNAIKRLRPTKRRGAGPPIRPLAACSRARAAPSEPEAGTDTKETQRVVEADSDAVLIEQGHVAKVEHPTRHPPSPLLLERTELRPFAYKIEFKWGQDLLKRRSLMTHLMARLTHRSHFRANWS